jgi:hypothetical protein
MPDGSQIPHQTIPLDHLNGMLVDTGRNVLLFCDRFISRLQPDEETLVKRGKALHRTFLGLTLKYSFGRDDDAMEAVRKEIAEMDGGAAA